MRGAFVFLFVLSVGFKPIVKADGENVKSNSAQQKDEKQGSGMRGLTYNRPEPVLIEYIYPIPIDDEPEVMAPIPIEPFDPIPIDDKPEVMITSSASVMSHDPDMTSYSDMPEDPSMYAFSAMSEGPALYSVTDMPHEISMTGFSDIPHEISMTGFSDMSHDPYMTVLADMPHDPYMTVLADMPHEISMTGFSDMSHDPYMTAFADMPHEVSMTGFSDMSHDPYMAAFDEMPHEVSMTGFSDDMYIDPYIHGDPYMHGDPFAHAEPYMHSEPCECPCRHDYDNYDSYEHYYDSSYDKEHYYSSYGKEHVHMFKDIGHFIPKISGEISMFRPVIHDVRLMISQWDSLAALEDLMSSSEGISLTDILPRNTDYSIIGQEILNIMDKTEFERILEIAESFFKSNEVGLVSYHMMTYDGSSPAVEFVIDTFRKSGVVKEFMRQFGEITWLRKAAMMSSELPWVQALVKGVGRILQIEDYIDELKMSAVNIETERFGGCSEASILRRCADETFSSLEAVQNFQTYLVEGSLAFEDDDPAVLALMGCIMTDTLCKEPSAVDLAEFLRPRYENTQDCFSAALQSCSLNVKTTRDYLSCIQNTCN